MAVDAGHDGESLVCYFDHKQNLNTPNLSPMPEKKMALGSGISGLHLWIEPTNHEAILCFGRDF